MLSPSKFKRKVMKTEKDETKPRKNYYENTPDTVVDATILFSTIFVVIAIISVLIY